MYEVNTRRYHLDPSEPLASIPNVHVDAELGADRSVEDDHTRAVDEQPLSQFGVHACLVAGQVARGYK